MSYKEALHFVMCCASEFARREQGYSDYRERDSQLRYELDEAFEILQKRLDPDMERWNHEIELESLKKQIRDIKKEKAPKLYEQIEELTSQLKSAVITAQTRENEKHEKEKAISDLEKKLTSSKDALEAAQKNERNAVRQKEEATSQFSQLKITATSAQTVVGQQQVKIFQLEQQIADLLERIPKVQNSPGARALDVENG
jgi:chromosome segregation ATPase